MSTFVLIPGAWHGAWCYTRVTDALRAKGHRVYPVTLTGLAERSHLCSDDVNLDTYIKDVANLFRWEQLDGVCLVAHSYAGIVAGGVAELVADKVQSIVFLDAFMPEAGKSMVDISPRNVPDTGTLPPYSAEGMRVNEADRAWVDAMVTPQPVNTYTQPLERAERYLTIPKKTYVRTTFPDSAWQELYEKYTADPEWRTYVVESGHDVMIDAPDELVQILLEVA